ncbi:hypothetical protein BsWGS_04294 [Bradybaena similaris]
MRPDDACFLTAMLLELMVLTVSSQDNIPMFRDYGDYLDPCKAEGYSGDVALTHNQFRATKKMMLKQTTNESYFELPVDDNSVDKRYSSSELKNGDDLQRARLFLETELKNRILTFGQLCKGSDAIQCRLQKMKWRKEVLNIRIKMMRMKARLNSLDRGVNEVNRVEKPYRRNFYEARKQFKNTDFICEDGTKNCSIHKHNVPFTQHSIHKRAATADKKKLWEFGVIPYVIDDKFSSRDKALFKLAVELWEEHTCLVFKEKEPSDKDFIIFTEGTCGCCSHVGRRGGGQAISIGKGCEKLGIVTHELGHVIGFQHEHVRPDRDKYIQVVWEHIEKGEEYNFHLNNDTNSLGEEYDFDSIMHYSRDIFAKKPNLNTMIPHRRPGMILPPQIGQRVKPSEGDIIQVAKMYGCAKCGSTLLDSSGGFVHTSKLGVPDLCQWRISCTHGEKVDVTISSLNIPESRNCETDYLDVRDGYYHISPQIKRFCGNHSYETLTSTDNQMWIEFKTSNKNISQFTLDYECTCGGDIVKDEGILTSPNYPDDYPSLKHCVWNITVTETFTVGLTFEMFDLESHRQCTRDYVELRDGATKDSPILGTFCGSQMPKSVTTTGRHLYVKFVSSKYHQRSGFFARFVKEVDECRTSDHDCEHNCVNTLGSYYCTCRSGFQLHSDGKRCEPSCGGSIDDAYGNITSPSFPDVYPANSKCVWTINAPAGHRIYLNFTHFDLEGEDQACIYDNLTIADDSGEISNVFCGYILPAYVSSINSITIEFRSDGTVQKSGFSAIFVTDINECDLDKGGCEQFCKNTIGSYQCECEGGFSLNSDMHTCKSERCHHDIESNDGIFHSPNYPGPYLGREDCSWLIVTVPGHSIHLEFVMFNLETSNECSYDYLAIYDGTNITAPQLGKFCGPTLPDPITSSSNSIYVSFFSDASVQREGFTIKHDVKCGATLQALETEQVFVSHVGYGDKDYDVKQDCRWLIVTPRNRFIQLTFTEFELESEPNCYYDVVFVYNGQDDTDPVQGKYCGIEIPDTIISSSNYLLVNFLSDYVVTRKGFSATYKLL